MTFRDYVLVMSAGTGAVWVAFAVVLLAIDPTRSGALGFALFYATFGLSIIGTLAIAGTAVRTHFHPEDVVSRQVARAFRQALLIGAILIGCMLLSAAGLFRPWTGIVLVLAAALVELAFLAAARPKAGV
jgi:hypothetical protein